MEALNIIGRVLYLLGSLGLFLFGMKLMSESLQKVAGNKIRNILSSITSNRFKGVLTGFLITAIIQSSSATTVMVVSFVNAGLLTLIEAIGVIMGANIGTTVTAWIISLLGFKISMSAISIPLIGLSFPLFFSKKSNRKSLGELLMGFAILFIGLQFLKESVPDIKSNPEAFDYLRNYTSSGYLSILLFVGIGTLLTVIIQSSSATMALTLVMCYNGLVPFELGAAMVLGENIGTTITANVAALVTNVSAKRAAVSHFIFNIIGVIWILFLFHPFLRGIDILVQHNNGVSILNNNMTETEFEKVKQVLPIALSIFHSAFNIMNTCLLIGFAPLIAKIATKIVPSKDEEEEFVLKHLDTRYLSTSELSLMQAKNETAYLGRKSSKMYDCIPKLLNEKKDKNYYYLLKKINKYEDYIDALEEEIGYYLTKISESDLSDIGSKKVRAMLKIIDDIESIGDTCYQMSKKIDSKKRHSVHFPQEVKINLDKMFVLVKEALNNMNENLNDDYNNVTLNKCYEIENKINKLRDDLRSLNIKNIRQEKYSYQIASYYSELFSLGEKVGDFVLNVNQSMADFNPNKKLNIQESYQEVKQELI